MHTYNEKYGSQLKDGANDASCTDEGSNDTSCNEQSSSGNNAAPGHKGKVIVFIDQPTTNTNDSQGNGLQGQKLILIVGEQGRGWGFGQK